MTAVTTRPTHHQHRARVLDLYVDLVDDYVTTAVASRLAEREGNLELADSHRDVADRILEQLAAKTALTAAQIRGHLHERVTLAAKPRKTLMYRLTHL